ncbi:MAG: NUDIX hydrolase [Dorea sp.]
MSNEVKRVSRKLAYKGAIIEVYKDRMKFANGNEEEWDTILHHGAAAVVPVIEDGRILMVTQYRNPLERMTLEIPAGKLDYPGEPGIVCATRELEEETGFKSDCVEGLISIRTTAAFCNEKIEIFVARNLKSSMQHLDENEYVDVKPYTVEELKKMIYEGKIEDSKTVAAILAYEDKYLK